MIEPKPHITENIDGKFVLSYGEEIMGTFPTMREAIKKTAGDKFIYTAHNRPTRIL